MVIVKFIGLLDYLTFMTPIEGKTCIDHIDNNRTNNCLSNLRWASHSENNHNMSITKSNTSGHKGVTFNYKAQKWKAQIKLDGLQIHLGSFDNKENAIACTIKKLMKYLAYSQISVSVLMFNYFLCMTYYKINL